MSAKDVVYTTHRNDAFFACFYPIKKKGIPRRKTSYIDRRGMAVRCGGAGSKKADPEENKYKTVSE
jgi:hypothetical protein